MFGLELPKPQWRFNLFQDPHVPGELKQKLRNGHSVLYDVSFDFDNAKSQEGFATSISGIAHFNVLIAPLGVGQNTPDGYLIQFQDITDLKNAQNKLLKYQQQLRTLASQLSIAEEQERRRLAADLHDEVGQSLAMIKFNLESVIERTFDTDDAGQLNKILKLVEETIENTRSLTFDLSPPPSSTKSDWNRH